MFDSEVLRDHVSSQVNIANERKKYSESKTIPGGGVFLLLYKLVSHSTLVLMFESAAGNLFVVCLRLWG